MRFRTLLSLLLLGSICVAAPACDTPNSPPNANENINRATPAAAQTPAQTPQPSPAQSPATPAQSPASSPVASASPLGKLAKPTYNVYKDASGQWRWQLVAANNRIVADSGEGYHNKQDCLSAIELVRNSKDAPLKERP